MHAHGHRIKMLFADITLLSLSLIAFSLFHHVIPNSGGKPLMSIVSINAATTAAPTDNAPLVFVSVPSITAAGEAVPSAEPAPTPVIKTGDFSNVFPSGDTGVNALKSYQSEDLKISVTMHQENGVTYFVADVWCRNISSFRTAFAKGEYGRSIHQNTVDMAANNNAVIAISGDYYGFHDQGIVIRNGALYRDTADGKSDVCVLYSDGTIQTYGANEFSIDEAINRGAYQAWCFGPRLLKNGQTMEKDAFNSSVKKKNPRCAIGYYEPGHYCLVTVDGRRAGYSDGMSLEEMSVMFFNLGCKEAYNLDGGQTAMMVFQSELVNQPYKGGRECSDIVYFGEV